MTRYTVGHWLQLEMAREQGAVFGLLGTTESKRAGRFSRSAASLSSSGSPESKPQFHQLPADSLPGFRAIGDLLTDYQWP
jgi:hypothetical protein